jgi:signal transduction histidine kinase
LAGDHEDSTSIRYLITASVDADRSEILAAYQRNLETTGSPIVLDPVARRQAMVQADQIITDVVHSLREGRVHLDEGYRLLAWDIGATRAATGMHPRESLKAAAIFFEAATTSLARHISSDPESIGLFVLIVLALNQSISDRIREAATTYSGYLLERIHEAHLEERRRIALELHDRIGSVVSLAHRQLELYELYSTTEPARASARVVSAQQAIQEIMHNIRGLTSDLRLQEPLKSLEKALLRYIDSARADDVTIRVRVNGDESWAPPGVADESFLVLREAVRNALTHAKPTMVLVRVDIAPHELRASVVDNGVGFDTSHPSSGVGLSAMQERAALMGGVVTVSSRPGRGTHVDLLVPLPGHQNERA